MGWREYGGVCANEHIAAVGTTAAGPIARLQGLPRQANHELAPEYGDLAWSVNGDLFVTLAQFVLDSPVGTLPADPPRAQAHHPSVPLPGWACLRPTAALSTRNHRAAARVQREHGPPSLQRRPRRRRHSRGVGRRGRPHCTGRANRPTGRPRDHTARRRLPHLEQLSHSGRAQASCLPCMWPAPNIESHPRREESVLHRDVYDPPHARVGGCQPPGVTAACRPAPPGGAGIQGAAPRRGRWTWGTG